ncbi:MAG TPA: TIGR03619 family F420-dependent LLM class oxidoreductase [Pseudonocardiaceae bacterium]|nr:TIGR03619 family F420-dependent LLM class oxidoreductase [Pseudonocardiaceae bacterium]
MKIGFGAPVSGTWATPANQIRFARLAEEHGYQSLWTFQRLLADQEQQLPPVYQQVLDPLVSLGFLAAHTTRVRLGVAVVNLPFVAPAYLAKQAATLDLLSGGRLDLGLGAGWSPEEFTATGATTARRGPRTEEYLRVLRSLWSDEVIEFSGEFYEIPASRAEPKPAQRPGPPILLGGGVPAALARAGRLADGWVSASSANLSRIGDSIAIVRSAAERAGRDPAGIRIVCRAVVRYGEVGVRDAEGGRRRLTGTAGQIREDVAWLAEQGVTELFYDLNFDPAIGNPHADEPAATERAEEILHELAPAG